MNRIAVSPSVGARISAAAGRALLSRRTEIGGIDTAGNLFAEFFEEKFG
jgi:hypothetical protein